MEQVKEYSNAFEDVIESIGAPLKPYVPVLARFFLVVTFFEDSLRILFQWQDQNNYLHRYRSMPWGVTHLFLGLNVLIMLVGSVMAIAKKHTEIAIAGLFF